MRYDYFFSHDWRTSGRLKYVSLLIVFNGVPAALSSFVVSTCLGVLTYFGYWVLKLFRMYELRQ